MSSKSKGKRKKRRTTKLVSADRFNAMVRENHVMREILAHIVHTAGGKVIVDDSVKIPAPWEMSLKRLEDDRLEVRLDN